MWTPCLGSMSSPFTCDCVLRCELSPFTCDCVLRYELSPHPCDCFLRYELPPSTCNCVLRCELSLHVWLYPEVWTLFSRVIVSWGVNSPFTCDCVLRHELCPFTCDCVLKYKLSPHLCACVLRYELSSYLHMYSHHDKWISKSWATAPRRDAGYSPWDPLVTTFLSSDYCLTRKTNGIT